MAPWQNILLIGLVGGLGAISRYGLGSLLNRFWEGSHWATFVVNVLGCLIFGLVVGLSDQRQLFSPEVKIILLAGFAGSFTTFSTLVFDSHQLISGGHWLVLIANVAGQLLLGLAALLLGLALTRSF